MNKFFKDVSQKEALSWAFYDFANSSYSLLILSFVFPIFFREVIAPGKYADFWWGLSISVSILLGGLVNPIIGAIADYDAQRKRKFIFFSSLSILGTMLLFFSSPNLLLFTIVLFIVTNLSFEIAQTLYDSFLLHVSTPETSGRISGLGWGLGYLGGILAMLLLKPLYGQGYAHLNTYKLTFVGTGLFFLLFAMPAFLFIKEHTVVRSQEKLSALMRIGLRNTLTTLKDIRQHKEVAWFLLGFYLLNDALVTIFSFVPIYAKVTLGMTFAEITIILILVQLVGFPTSIFFGWLSDRKGSKAILLCTIFFWALIVIGLALATSKMMFYILAIMTGFVIGSSQAVARSWFSKLIPAEKRCEFFGFNGFASKIAATTGPVIFGLISSITQNQRYGMISLALYFVLSFIIFVKIPEIKEKQSLA